MKKNTIIIFLNFTFIFLAGNSYAFGQKNEVDLKDKRITVNFEKQPLGIVFRYLMENYDIPIGFEWSLLDKDHNDYNFDINLPVTAEKILKGSDTTPEIRSIVQPGSKAGFKADFYPITVNFDNAKLEDVLNEIVRQMNFYKWEINDDVVNIFPTQGRHEKFAGLLDTKISQFTFEKGKTVRDITANIKELPEFIKYTENNNLIFWGDRTNVSFRKWVQYDRTIDAEMNFSNLTFRELLNKITKIKKGGWKLEWIITLDKGIELIDIDI